VPASTRGRKKVTNDRETRKVEIESLRLEECCQAREKLDDEALVVYAEAYSEEDHGLPPIEVVDVDGDLVVVDGFHRVAAARMAGRKFITVDVVTSGNLEFASWEALSKNHDHGVRRTRDDKKKAVWLALDNDIGQEQSSREIAKHLGVSHTFVGKIREKWEVKWKADHPGQGGNVATPLTDTGGQEATPADTNEPADEFAADAAQAAELADDYKAVAKLLGRLWNSLCESLGAADPVCVKVNKAIRLAEERAGAPDTTTKVQALAS
jgi:hypothetical protein